MLPECPNCEKHFRGPRCPVCGWEPVGRGTAGPPPVDLCSWDSSREPCVFLATIWPTHAGRDTKGRNLRSGFCAWHYETLLLPRLADEFAEFERFVLHRRATCTQFSHHGAGYLWDTIQGQRRAAQHREVAQPCAAAACWVWDALEQEKRAALWVPPAAYRATSFHELVGQVAKRLAVEIRHAETV